ncbi:MAG: PQQ-binding-like beta-propeller repeat protein [Anaerolineae bacterium]|nr:MAG: PQQ-binding-like beta-propeller repeat protein [Anaerolineae bacterium]
MKKSHLLILLMFTLLLVACSQENPWPGVSKTDDNEVFVSYERFIAKLDANGKRIWVFPEKDERETMFYAPPVVDDGTVYVGDYNGNVYAVDRETGKEIWAYKVGGTKLFGIANFGGSTDRVIAPIAIAENILFVPDELGVFALNKETGKLLNWKLDSDRAVWSQPIYVPATEDKPAMLFAASLDHSLYALDVSEIDLEDTVGKLDDAEEAEVLWKADLEGAAAGQPTYDVERGILFVGTFGSKMLAVSAEDGDILGEYETEGWVWEGPTLYDGVLYFGDIKGYLHAVTFNDGNFERIWSRQVAKGKLRARPLVTDDLVIVASDDNTIYAVRRDTGEREWERDVESKALADLFQIQGEDGWMLVTATANKDELVIALRLDNGNERWSYKHED